jgi:DNA-binding response OmpR family regulator
VGDGQAALESVRKSAPDLIVLDLVIPRIDGYRVCELIKADEHYKHIPVIMLSVRSQVMEKKAGFAVGADEYLTKPYDPQLLLSKIKNLLKNQR